MNWWSSCEKILSLTPPEHASSFGAGDEESISEPALCEPGKPLLQKATTIEAIKPPQRTEVKSRIMSETVAAASVVLA